MAHKTAARKTAARKTAARAATPLGAGRELWLAGLGLAGAAIEAATDTFDALVKEGKTREPQVRAAAARVVRKTQKHARGVAAGAAKASKQALGEALDALGVDNRPRQKNLFHRLGDLTDAVL
jgi:polyhydroxyalkanoate synthesis regulator phasin